MNISGKTDQDGTRSIDEYRTWRTQADIFCRCRILSKLDKRIGRTEQELTQSEKLNGMELIRIGIKERSDDTGNLRTDRRAEDSTARTEKVSIDHRLTSRFLKSFMTPPPERFPDSLFHLSQEHAPLEGPGKRARRSSTTRRNAELTKPRRWKIPLLATQNPKLRLKRKG